MKFGTSIMIFFLAILALVAEFVLYMIFGLGAAFSGDFGSLMGTAFFFVCLMVLTAATGVLSPICALIELAAKRKNLSLYIMLPTLGLIMVGLVVFGLVGTMEMKQLAESTPAAKVEQGDPEKRTYFDKVVVRKIRIRKSILDETGVYGEIKNTGDQSLRKVEITIYCLDRSGKPIFEKAYHPVLVSKYSFTESTPLRPNYSRKFGVKLDDAPSDWAGKVRIEVSDLEFQDK